MCSLLTKPLGEHRAVTKLILYTGVRAGDREYECAAHDYLAVPRGGSCVVLTQLTCFFTCFFAFVLCVLGLLASLLVY